MSDERLRTSYDHLMAVRAEMSTDRKACPSVESLVALLRREGEEDDRLTLLDHVMSCPFCQSEFALLRTTMRASSAEQKPVLDE